MTGRPWLSLLVLVPLCGAPVAQPSMNDVVVHQRGVSHHIPGAGADSITAWARRALDGPVSPMQLLVGPDDVAWARAGTLAVEVRFGPPHALRSLGAQVAHVLVPLGPEGQQRFGAGAVALFWGGDARSITGLLAVHDPALLAEVQRLAAAAADKAPARPGGS